MDPSDLCAALAPAAETGPVARWRAQARELLARLGLPGQQDEHWRRADLRFLEGMTPGILTATQAQAPGAVEATPGLARLRAHTHLCFDGGRFAPAPSRLGGDDAVCVGRLAAAAGPDAPALPGLASHRGLVDDLRLALLGRAAGADGAQMLVLRGRTPRRPLVLEHIGLRTGGATAFVSHRLCLEPGASAVLVEYYDDRSAPDFTLLGELSIELGRSSRLLHLRLVAPTQRAHLVDTLQVELGRDAEYVQRSLIAPACALRSTQVVHLAGDGSRAVLHAGAFAGLGSDLDLRLLAEHEADATRSEQTVQVLAARARATVDSEVMVPPGRRRVVSRQSLRAVLLEPGCDVALRPRLAIRSDDVDSRHGATTAALAQEQLFYLRSRGLDAAQARRVLVAAQLRQVFPETGDEALDTLLRGLLQGALDRALGEPGGGAS